MANKYAYNKETNEAKTARAMAKSLKISPKHCVEICNAIRGMEVTKAKNYLEDVIDMKKSVPFKRHNRQVGHRKGQEGWAAGRYPVNHDSWEERHSLLLHKMGAGLTESRKNGRFQAVPVLLPAFCRYLQRIRPDQGQSLRFLLSAAERHKRVLLFLFLS